jgi:hypothetical protein
MLSDLASPIIGTRIILSLVERISQSKTFLVTLLTIKKTSSFIHGVYSLSMYITDIFGVLNEVLTDNSQDIDAKILSSFLSTPCCGIVKDIHTQEIYLDKLSEITFIFLYELF